MSLEPGPDRERSNYEPSATHTRDTAHTTGNLLFKVGVRVPSTPRCTQPASRGRRELTSVSSAIRFRVFHDDRFFRLFSRFDVFNGDLITSYAFPLQACVGIKWIH